MLIQYFSLRGVKFGVRLRSRREPNIHNYTEHTGTVFVETMLKKFIFVLDSDIESF